MNIMYATNSIHYMTLELGIFPNVNGKPLKGVEQKPAY